MVTFRFKQYRVHLDRRCDPCCLSLDNLSPAHFVASRRDEGVERHVLRFERRDSQSLLFENPAQRRDQNALSNR
jgi:hypothetical protein